VHAPEAVAWRDLCRRLESLGDRLLTNEFPAADDHDRADGYRHLVEQVVTFLAWSVLHADPRRPAFHRHNDLVGRWGGPNVDNVYRHARVEPSRRYAVRGHMHGCDDFILAARAGFMHMPEWGTLRTLTASELGIGRGDEFDLVLDDLPDGTAMVSVREYYLDWQPDEPATFTIECLDDDGPDGRLTGDEVAARLADAGEHIERSMTYWNRYLTDARAGQVDNAFTPPVEVAKGLAVARYAYCFWDLAPGQALVIDTDVPAARYWSLQLYNLGWFEAFDVDDRITSLNHTQARVDDDGRVHVVVSGEDVGALNWLDTGGRRSGLVMLRWFWPTGGPPAPATRVVDVGDARGPVDAEARRAQRRARLDHLAWRFRT
jgi:hypothetical protein